MIIISVIICITIIHYSIPCYIVIGGGEGQQPERQRADDVQRDVPVQRGRDGLRKQPVDEGGPAMEQEPPAPTPEIE